MAKKIVLFLNYNKGFCSIFYLIFCNLFPLNTVCLYSHKNKYSLIQMCDIPLKSTELPFYDGFFFPSLCVSYAVMSLWFKTNELSTQARSWQVLSAWNSNQLQRKHSLPPGISGSKYSISLYFSIITLGNTWHSTNIEFSQLPEPALVVLDRSVTSCIWFIFGFFDTFFSPLPSPPCTDNNYFSCNCAL